MFLIKLEIKKEKYKIYIKEENKFDLFDYLKMSEISEYYEDEEKYLKENVVIITKKLNKTNIYHVLTEAQGYGTYQGAVCKAYSKDRALNMLEEKNVDFNNSEIVKIGKSTDDKEEIILTDYFNG